MKLHHRIARITIAALTSITLILLLAGGVITLYVNKKLKSELESLNVTVSSVSINPFSRSAIIHDLAWTHSHESLSGINHQLSAKNIRLGGLSLLQLLIHKRIHVRELTIDSGNFLYNNTIKIKRNKTNRKSPDLKAIFIGRLAIEHMAAKLANDSTVEYSALINLWMENIQVTDLAKAANISSYKIKSVEALITKVQIAERGSMYNTCVSRIYVNSDEKKIVIDSLLVLPVFSKYQFSRKLGRQVDRLTVSIPQILITDFSFDQLKDTLLLASLIEIRSANLHVFRDKRLPFIKQGIAPLPMAMINALPYAIAIDTIRLTDTKITYEEFPEQGFHSGEIHFEDLNATLDHLSNRGYFSNYKQSTLSASSRVMKTGFITAEFSLPYEVDQIYNAKGSINGLALQELNPLLENLVFVNVESGTLNQLSFNFDYNDVRSRGSVLIDYQNLKIRRLTKEKVSTTNEFKSWIINIILKRDKSKSVSKEKRTGTIDFTRDPKRAVIHLWIKSLFSGLKSSVTDTSAKKEKAN